jgi:coenzyme F420-reducing hydrogenase beta subunit
VGWDPHGHLKARGEWIAKPSDRFARLCPFSPAARNEDEIAAARFPDASHRDPRIGSYEQAYVGHAAEGTFRAGGSSGGMVTWIAAELLRRGEIDGVAHVVPCDPQTTGRFFDYAISRDEAAVLAGGRSRYYPVELSRVLAEIRAVPGRYAIVGVPCFIKAVRLLCDEDTMLAERIRFTLGLFCGHMKSARLVESFAWQLDAPMREVRTVDYRLKSPDRPANWYTAHLGLADGSARRQDWWHLADGDWGAGFFQNPACDYCDDVVAETADISFGDAWIEPHSSDGRGTNVVIARSASLRDILEEGVALKRLSLDPIDAAFIVETQAAGLRHRREGLAYRLRIAPPRLPLRKRVAPGGRDLSLQRKLVYRTRRGISIWSHRISWVADRLKRPALYIIWARTALLLYQALAHGRGPLGRAIARYTKRKRRDP